MSNPQSNNFHRLEIYQWKGEGYRPFVSYGDWVVALMNWEPRFDLNALRTVERHNKTDEVFVLTRGRSILFIDTDAEIQAVDMQPGVIYNVTRGTWHNIIGTKDASWLIVESRHTSEENSDYRELGTKEIEAVKTQFPACLDGE